MHTTIRAVKLVLTLCTLMMWSAVSVIADTNAVYSVNVMGYQRIPVPAHGLSLGASPYQKSPSRLDDVIGDQMTPGTAEDPGKADSAYFYNSAQQVYEIAYLYSDGSNAFWIDGKTQLPATNVILPGAGFWLRSSQDQNQNVYVVGDVVTAGSVTNKIVQGLQMLSYPYSVPVNLADLALADHAVKGRFLNQADNIYIWKPAQQGYRVLYYYTDGSLIDFETGDVVTTCILKPGEGFWYKHRGNGFDWVEAKPYTSP